MLLAGVLAWALLTRSGQGRGLLLQLCLRPNATLHCLIGCAIGEIAGLMIGPRSGSAHRRHDRPRGRAGVPVRLRALHPAADAGWVGFFAAVRVVFAADTLSIAVMEFVDNLVMALIRGAMDAGLVNPIFWLGMMIALTVASIVAFR